MKLFSYWRSSAAYRVRIALNLKGLDFETVAVDLVADAQRAPDYLGVNPQGLVPALDTGAQLISQSMAILEYLEETAPQPPLLPVDAAARAVVRGLAQLVVSDMHPLNNLRVLRYLREELQAGSDAVDGWYRHWVAAGFEPLEAQVAAHGDRRHCYGDGPTLADVCLIPQLYNARRFDCDLAPYPRLRAIEAHLLGLPAFAAAAPEQQPDAPG